MITLTDFSCVLSLLHLQQSPLLLAAKNGHTKCVTHLLRKGAKVLQRDSSGKNCLILAVQNLHEYVKLACDNLSHSKITCYYLNLFPPRYFKLGIATFLKQIHVHWNNFGTKSRGGLI